VTHEPLAAFLGSGPLKLLPDNAAGGQAGLWGSFRKPLSKLVGETDGQSITHLPKM